MILATARDQISDRIAGLDAGADDYVVKPYDLDELSARIRANARRGQDAPSPVVELGGVSVDRARRRVFRGPEEIRLTQREWALAAAAGALWVLEHETAETLDDALAHEAHLLAAMADRGAALPSQAGDDRTVQIIGADGVGERPLPAPTPDPAPDPDDGSPAPVWTGAGCRAMPTGWRS